MTKLFAMAVPILPGQTEHWHRFCDTLTGEKSNEYKASREKLEVRECVFLQHTPQGDLVIVTLEGNDPESALTRFAQGRDTFTQWFINEVKTIHGLDLTSPPRESMPELYADTGEIHASTY